MTDHDITPKPGEFVFGMDVNDTTRMLVGTAMLKSRTEGKTYMTIAEEWGTTHPTVMKYTKRALDSYVLPEVEVAKKEMLEQIDSIIEVWLPRAQKSNDKATEIVGKYMDRKTKLLGLDAPIKVQQTVREISKEEADLMALIEQTQHEEAMRLEALKNDNYLT